MIYPFFSLSSITYSYKDIVDIRTAPKCKAPSGKIVDNGDKDHVIQFSDGYKWSTFWIWAGTDDEEKGRLIEFVSAKSGKPVRQLPILGQAIAARSTARMTHPANIFSTNTPNPGSTSPPVSISEGSRITI